MNDTPGAGRRRALVLGFTAFGEVVHNPSECLARAVDNTRSARWSITGRSMPVSYRRCVEHTARLVAELNPHLVLGVGVAMQRDHIALERWGRAVCSRLQPDVDGRTAPWRNGPGIRPARLPVDRMARAANIRVSDDCGTYVCNAWLYTVLGALGEHLQVGFLHVPGGGGTVETLHAMLDAVGGPTDG